MQGQTIKLGFAPTRRAIFSAPAAVVYRKLTADRLREMNAERNDKLKIWQTAISRL